ncbi:MAG: exosortase/archaeosortase family protein [Balneolales bacterium]|nr:exosortase/archaeosortase family protein [Balneolales bacterium]
MKELFFGKYKAYTVFLAKLLGFFGLWYLMYEVWILPDGRLDAWLSVNIVEVSAGLLSLLNFDIFSDNRVLGITGAPGVIIINGCNGLEAIGLFIGFVMAWPGDNFKRALFVPMGILVIYVVNMLRVCVLVILQHYSPQSFDFAHDYSTSTIFYLAIFVMWVVWINFGEKNKIAFN